MGKKIFSNAHIVTRDDDFIGSIVIEDGIILDVCKNKFYLAGEDLSESWLIPGIIDLHSDYIEREFSPRPNTGFPPILAIRNLDLRALSSGITCLFNGISFREGINDNRSIDLGIYMADALEAAIESRILLIKHYIHARIDVTNESILNDIDKILLYKDLKVAVYNDHTPGTRQFRNIDKYKDYASDRSGINENEIMQNIKDLQKQAEKTKHVRPVISNKLKKSNLIIGSHDDTTIEHVDEAIENGISFCEFPTTFEAAEYAKKKNITTLMGAPNLVLGKSQSGNISCRKAVEKGLVDVLCSDYHFPAMVSSALFLIKNGMKPSEAVNMITYNPAKTIKMENQIGSIEIGNKADIIIFDEFREQPLIKQVYINGKNVYQLNHDFANGYSMSV